MTNQPNKQPTKSHHHVDHALNIDIYSSDLENQRCYETRVFINTITEVDHYNLSCPLLSITQPVLVKF